jgi:hypothetical protein
VSRDIPELCSALQIHVVGQPAEMQKGDAIAHKTYCDVHQAHRYVAPGINV